MKTMSYALTTRDIDCLERLQLELELESTYAVGNGQFGPSDAETMLPSSRNMPGHCELPLNTKDSAAELQEAVSSNINNTLNNSFFSIYGGINGIWDKNSSSANSWRNSAKELANRSTTFEDIFRRSFYDEYQSLFSHDENLERYSGFSSLASTDGTGLSERLIEDTLKTAFDLPPQENTPKPVEEHPVRAVQKNQRSAHPSSGKSRKGSKQPPRDEVKEPEANGRKEARAQEKKRPNAWKTNKNAGGTPHGAGSNARSEFTEAGSINNILEASEIWLRHTTGSNMYNKKGLLKKPFPNQDKFSLGVS
ncbi:hypothetical protein, conserved [Babesia bigemina]|uniref:Uncharacterized protein n=1 Tax=Babesia bigemina TaxID=5866 RepID=A0A061D973_BABBI|nr:hypothetical protein, conserved [Babesia bigemina]CDR96532.1 hypothetical protein, conserved [Babesia bigemina]|eukprot:XP_012768718.1 hypothetical protein, conserved [Babesia bigemina]